MGTHTGRGMMLTAIWQTQPDRPKLEKHTASSLATVSTSACHNAHSLISVHGRGAIRVLRAHPDRVHDAGNSADHVVAVHNIVYIG